MKALKKFIKNNCADYFKGECTGMTVHNETFRREGQCWVPEGRKCPYFERYVLGPVDYKFRPDNYAVISGEYKAETDGR